MKAIHVLRALYEAAPHWGCLTDEEAQLAIDGEASEVGGVPIFVYARGDVDVCDLDLRKYTEFHGEGTAEKALEKVPSDQVLTNEDWFKSVFAIKMGDGTWLLPGHTIIWREEKGKWICDYQGRNGVGRTPREAFTMATGMARPGMLESTGRYT